MKRIFRAALCCAALLLLLPGVVRAAEFYPSIVVTRTDVDTITVTVSGEGDNAAVLAAQRPTLTVDCDFAEAYVSRGGAAVVSALLTAESRIRFSVSAPGDYVIRRGRAPALPVGPALPAPPVLPEKTAFADVEEGAVCYDAVAWAVGKGVTRGITPLRFAPAASCTRGQAATLLWRALGCPAAAGTMPFADVERGASCWGAVLWAAGTGVARGVSATAFAPGAAVTRGQFLTFLWRAAGSPASGAAVHFTDVAADAVCRPAVAWAVEKGISDGVSPLRFAPGATVTRGQAVTFLWRWQNG